MEEPTDSLLHSLVLYPNVNQLLFACLPFEELAKWRQLDRNMAQKLFQQVERVQCQSFLCSSSALTFDKLKEWDVQTELVPQHIRMTKRQFPNLRSLSLEEIWKRRKKVVVTIEPPIRRLILSRHEYVLRLYTWNQLEQLTILKSSFFAFVSNAGKTGKVSFDRLHTLSLLSCDEDDERKHAPVEESVDKHLLPSLTNLSIDRFSSSKVVLDFPHLEHVCLRAFKTQPVFLTSKHLSSLTFRGFQLEWLDQPSSSSSSTLVFPELESLQLQVYMPSSWSARIFPRLKHMSIGEFGWSNEVPLEMWDWPNAAPNLETLTCLLPVRRLCIQHHPSLWKVIVDKVEDLCLCDLPQLEVLTCSLDDGNRCILLQGVPRLHHLCMTDVYDKTFLWESDVHWSKSNRTNSRHHSAFSPKRVCQAAWTCVDHLELVRKEVYVDKSSNVLHALHSSFLRQQLRSFRIRGCSIQTPPHGISFGSFPRLEYLSFQDCHIGAHLYLQHLPRLHTLDLDGVDATCVQLKDVPRDVHIHCRPNITVQWQES